MSTRLLLPAIGVLSLALCALGAAQRGASVSERKLEGKDSYQQWLERDVAYIVTPEEAAVFRKLTTDEERSIFIEQFWERRNPNPGSATNEFKIEHYRRLQHANDRFTSGYDGWRTDRGRIYIMHGEPYHIEDHPGGRYDRPAHEGGGTTSAFPFQIWRYRYIPRIGSDVEIEFVDTTETGDYRIARDADDKDALLTLPGGGLTLDERAGLRTKGDRIDNRFVGNPNYFKYMREQDTPFARLYLKANLERPPSIQNAKLREAVTARVRFDSALGFKTSVSHLKIGERQSLVLLNLEVRNRDIAYAPSELGIRRGVIEVYGSVRALDGRHVAEFEHDMFSDAPDAEFDELLRKISVYQKALSLEPGVYKLELALRNRVSDELGLATIRIGVPNLAAVDGLAFSSLILCRGLVPLGDFPDAAGMFVLGDLKVIPNVEHAFERKDRIGIYTQVYNVEIDPSSLRPAVAIRYQVRRGDAVVKSLEDLEGKTVSFASGERLVLTSSLPIGDLDAGRYQIRIEVADRISGRRGEVRASFTVLNAVS